MRLAGTDCYATASLPARHAVCKPPSRPELRVDICVFTQRHPPRHVHLIGSLALGGAERIVAGLCIRLADSGPEVDVVLLRNAPAEHRLSTLYVGADGVLARIETELLSNVSELLRISKAPVSHHLTQCSKAGFGEQQLRRPRGRIESQQTACDHIGSRDRYLGPAGMSAAAPSFERESVGNAGQG